MEGRGYFIGKKMQRKKEIGEKELGEKEECFQVLEGKRRKRGGGRRRGKELSKEVISQREGGKFTESRHRKPCWNFRTICEC